MIGTPAPDFSLFDTEKKKLTLSELRGQNILLLFFPLAFTSTCTAELCSVRDNLSFYNSLDTVVIGISVDSLYTLKKYKEELNLNFSLVSDFNRHASNAYQCIYKTFLFEMSDVSKRAAFVIDAKGIIQYVEILEEAREVPNFDAITICLNKLI